jgi:HSP20 family protein
MGQGVARRVPRKTYASAKIWLPNPHLSLSAGLTVLTLDGDCIFLRIQTEKLSVEEKFAWQITQITVEGKSMTDFGAKRQRSPEENLTPSERTEGTTRRQSGGMERISRAGGYGPGIFSVSPGEFFTMSPITLMRRFTEDIDRAFSRFSGNAGRGSGQEDFNWIPAVEVRQSGNNLLIHADLPGLSENDVKLEATEEGLVIEGERKQEHSREEGGWHHSERAYGRFYRLIPLPENARVDEARANFHNGVLEVTVPVPVSESKRRQIPIGTGEQGRQSRQESPMTQAANAGQSRTASSGR